jgi:isopentenyl-diphosphate delta-isomerase
MSIVSEDMLIDAVTDADTPIGVVRRDEVFDRHVNFRVVHVLIFNSVGDLLIQQLAATRTRHPGYWGSSVAAYLFSGEGYEAGARRRIAEELGIHEIGLRFIGKTVMDDEGCHKFIGVFVATHNGPFHYDHAHIAALQFIEPSRIRDLRRAGALRLTPTFIRVLAFYESRRDSA